MARSEAQNNPIREALFLSRRAFTAAFVFGFFINALMLIVSIYSMQVFDRVLGSGSLDTLVMLTVVVAVAILFMAAFQWLRGLTLLHVSNWFDRRLAERIATDTVELALVKPDIGTQPLRDLDTLKGLIASATLNHAIDAPWAIVYFVVIFLINTTLGWVLLGSAVLMAVLSIVSDHLPKSQLLFAQESQILAHRSLDAVLRNSEVVRAMGFRAHALAAWAKHADDGATRGFDVGRLTNLISVVTRNVRLAIQTALTGLAAWLVIRGDMSSGAIIGASMLSSKALAPFDALVPIHQSALAAKKAYERLVEVMRVSDTLAETRIRLPAPEGRVTLDRISWQEPNGGRWVLRGINVEFAAGEAIGIIGPSGSGKTTLARMMTGILRPTTGAVRIDGADLAQWDPTELGPYLGYLPQDVELFDGTVAENIARLDASRHDDDIVAAAKLAQVHDLILQLPKGYLTQVGRSGSLLSAGQRQRVALARCFLGDVRVVVLDEPNSNLDAEGELALMRALMAAKARGITTISIVHRPSVVQRVDKILVLQNGEAKMFGPALEVLEKLAPDTANVQRLRRAKGVADDAE